MTAIEKFVAAMNQISPFWTKKDIEIVAKDGRIVTVRYDGFVFMNDEEK